MASVSTLVLILLIVFVCHYEGVGAGRHKGRGYGRGNNQMVHYRPLKFTRIISGQRYCRLQETIGWPLFREKLYCDTKIIVRDSTEEYAEDSNLYDRSLRPGERPTITIDNSTRSQAVSTTTRPFCVHRAVLAARSAYFEKRILDRLQGSNSWLIRNIGPIEIVDIHPDIFNYILQFIYTYQIDDFNPELHIIDLFVAAHILQMEELKTSIRDYILKDMTNSITQVHTIIKWLRWARLNLNVSLQQALIEVMRKVLKLESELRWREFGQFMCEITQANYARSLEPESRQPIIAK